MLYKRVLSALVGIPVFLLGAWYGGWLLFGLTAVIVLLALGEVAGLFQRNGLRASFPVMAVVSTGLLTGAFAGGISAIGMAVFPLVLLVLLFSLLLYPRMKPGDMAASLAGSFYVSLFLFLILLRDLEGGLVWTMMTLVATWAGDTLAYIVGKKLGRKKIAPRLSPGKTVEGTIAGIGGSILGTASFLFFFPELSVGPVLVLGLVLGLAGLLGDLFESGLKRNAGTKDSGRTIPGHGGLLDRFDSMLFTAPAAYYFIVAFF